MIPLSQVESIRARGETENVTKPVFFFFFFTHGKERRKKRNSGNAFFFFSSSFFSGSIISYQVKYRMIVFI